MSIALHALDIIGVAGMGLIIGIILNSKNTIGLVNAVGNVFAQTFGAAAGTIR